MTLIIPADIVERAREMANLYRPHLEEMFGVDLSGVGVRSFHDLPDDLVEFAQHLDAGNPRSELEKELAAMRKAPGELDREFFGTWRLSSSRRRPWACTMAGSTPCICPPTQQSARATGL